MGCCLTTPTAVDESKTNSKPPQPPVTGEEETVVKQVLSITSPPKTEHEIFKRGPKRCSGPCNTQQTDNFSDSCSKNARFSGTLGGPQPPSPSIKVRLCSPPILIKQEELNKKAVVVEENKAVSEEVSYSSYSASFSAATTSGVDIDEDGEVNKPMKPKLVSSSTRKVRGTPPSSVKRTTVQRHRNVGPSNVPASRRVLREETKQSRQIRRTKGTTTPKLTENKLNVKVSDTTNDDADVVQETGESLENPLVSLECFIFL